MLGRMMTWLGGLFGLGGGSGERQIGVVDHYFGKAGVAAINLRGSLSVGDTVHVKGHTTDFTQKVSSIQIEHASVDKAKRGDSIGIKIGRRVREHDAVYKITG